MLHIEISIAKQTLHLVEDGMETRCYQISSAKNGLGSEEGSYKTPLGNFIISEKHGHNEPINTIFKGRVPVGEWSPCQQCDDDLVTSRILWLGGIDNDNANTKQRYIYIHGTNHEDKLGSPHSCGCIRMSNKDVIELFDNVTENTPVRISP